MIPLNEICELPDKLAAYRGKPIVIGLPPRVVLDQPLNIKHNADITLRSDNTEIIGEQLTVESTGTVTFEGLAHFGSSEWDDKRKADYILKHANLGGINGRGLSAFARRIIYRNCTILNCLDDGWGGTADEIIVDRCLLGHSWQGDKGGLVTNAKRLVMTDCVCVGARYRQPVKADNVAEVALRRNVIVGACFHMEASGVQRWQVYDCWFYPEGMGLHRPICPQGGGVVLNGGNWISGRQASFSRLFGNLRGYNDKQNTPQVIEESLGALDYWKLGPDDYRRIVDQAGAKVVNELTMLARRNARENGGL